MFFYPLFVLLLSHQLLTADSFEEKLRIQTLLPDNLLISLAVEPALPPSFVARSKSGELDGYDWIYWGNEEALKAYFDDPATLKEPLIRVSLATTSQDEITKPDEKAFRESFNQMGFTEFTGKKFIWGCFPGYATAASCNDLAMHIAWVGLNTTEGWTMKFQLVYAEGKNKPSEADLALWDQFLHQTKQLSFFPYLKSHGQILSVGETFIGRKEARLHATAELRADKTLKVTVTPLFEAASFKPEEIGTSEVLIDGKKELLVKVHGIYDDSDDARIVSYQYLYILPKQVAEFSALKKEPRTLTLQKKL